MTQQLFRRANKTGTVGIWLAKVNTDLQEFCPGAYGKGLKFWVRDFRTFSIVNCAINFCNRSLRVWFEIKRKENK